MFRSYNVEKLFDDCILQELKWSEAGFSRNRIDYKGTNCITITYP